MYEIIVCDDNLDFLKAFVIILEKYAGFYNYSVMAFGNRRDLLDYCCDNKFDIVYMDIEIGKDNGIELAKTLKIINPKSLIIYISAYDTYFVDMVQAEPFRFICKGGTMPYIEARIVETLEAAINRFECRDIWSFTFRKSKYHIELSKVNYFCSCARVIYINGDIGDAPKYFYGKIDELQVEIEKINQNFARISKSYLVNMKHIFPIYGKSRIRIGSEILSVTRKYRNLFWEKYEKY